MMSIYDMIEKLGMRNADILITRYDQHQAGLKMAVDVSNSRFADDVDARAMRRVTTRMVGDIPNCTPVNALPNVSFLDQMKQIEQDRVHV